MKEKIKYFILLFDIFVFANCANAIEVAKNTTRISNAGIAFEVVLSIVILYLFLMGVKNCFHQTYKNYSNSSYNNPNKGYNLKSKENLTFDYETAKRVKRLMEMKKQNEFRKNSTINEHIKNNEKLSV